MEETPSGLILTRRRFVSGAAVGLALPHLLSTACSAQPAGTAQRSGPAVNLQDHGCVGNGVTDDGPGFARALEEAARRGLPLDIPRGTFLISDVHVYRTGRGFVPAQGLIIRGTGPGSALRFRRGHFPSFYGLTLEADDVHLQDLTLEVDRSGGSWVAAVCVTRPVRNLRFTRVRFRGVHGRTGHIGVLPLNADIDGLTFERCHFEHLDFGFSKQITDVSTQSGIAVTDCTAIDCTEVLEFNSPGLFAGRTRAGSNVVTAITGYDGTPFDTGTLKPGQMVRSPHFAEGTTVLAVHRDAITLSSRASSSSPPLRKGRLSAGGCRNGIIRNLRVRDIAQWAVGFANCENWLVEIHGQDVAYELVHVEDGSRNFRIIASGTRCNLRPGVVGSPEADNGMVHVSTGSHEISVRFANVDLTGRHGGEPNALCVQAGGEMGTTGREVDPHNIRVSGRVLMGSGSRAVVAYNSDVTFEELEMINVEGGIRTEPMMRLHGSTWSGSIRVANPGPLVEPHPWARGRFDRVQRVSG